MTLKPFGLARWRNLLAIGLLSLALALLQSNTLAAERVTFDYRLLQLSVPVDSLKRFATEGVVDSELRFWLRLLDEPTRLQLRQLLQQPIDEDPAIVARFTYMNLGEAFLQRLGSLIQTDSHLNGFSALRSALILASADQPEGLTLLNVMQHFPGHDIRINGAVALRLLSEAKLLSKERDIAVQAIAQQSAQSVAEHPFKSQLIDLRQTGSYSVSQQALQIQVSQPRYTPAGRVSTYPLDVDLYLPEATEPVPLVIFTHSLGSTRSDFHYLGQHLASHGIAVAVPEHLGSDRDYLQAFLRGEVRNLVEPDEYRSRKTEITRLLDRLAQSPLALNWSGQFDLQKIGIMGYSLGGTTALSLAGGGVNQPQLQQHCVKTTPMTLDLSVLLQCLASQIPTAPGDWHDPRIKAVIAVYPPTSVILGSEGMGKIAVPTLIAAASHDLMAPAMLEQITPFQWLTTPNKYLALIDPGTHFTMTALGAEDRLPNFLKSTEPRPAPEIGQGYLQALSTAFFQVYLNHRTEYLPYLSPAYANQISQDELRLYLVQSLPSPTTLQK